MQNHHDYPLDAQWLNQHCLCKNIDLDCVTHRLTRLGSYASQIRSVFVNQVLYLQHTQQEQMNAIIKAIEAITAMPAYQSWVMARAAEICHGPYSNVGDFLSFDFHLTDSGPKLIEINTNPGAGYLSALLADCIKKCAHLPSNHHASSMTLSQTENALLEMFKSIWRQSRKGRALSTIAIVDTEPLQQFLYPEFLLFKQLFESAGIQVLILDPSELEIDQQQLCYKQTPIDMIYNRLTDFYLEQAEHALLRQSYLDDLVVLTPSPKSYALYADKKNLIYLTDPLFLQSFGLSRSLIDSLCSGIALTKRVDDFEADELWRMRREFYFKPSCGHGSKGVYRGAKLTRRVFQEILSNDYLLQTSIMPSKRMLLLPSGELQELSVDIRAFRVLSESSDACNSLCLDVARLYRGQTTNLSTVGGGFAAICTIT